MTLFLGILWSSIKQIKAPYLLDWEHEIALHAMQGNQASSCCEGEFSLFFSSYSRNLGYILELWWGRSFQPCVCSATSGLLVSYEGHLRKRLEAWQANTDASQIEAGAPVSLSFCHSDTGISINCQQESGIVSLRGARQKSPKGLVGPYRRFSR